MKKIRIALVPFLFASLFAASFTSAASAAEAKKPVAVVSFAGIEQAVTAAEGVSEMIGKPGVGQMINGLFGMYSQGKVSRTQPWAIAVFVDDVKKPPIAVLYLPCEDAKGLLGAFQGGSRTKKKELEEKDGVILAEVFSQKVAASQKGKWTLVSDKAENLSGAPEDPTALLEGLPKKYLLSYRVPMKDVPQALRDELISNIEKQMQMQAMLAGGADAAAAVGAAKENLAILADALKSTDDLSIGWKFDSTEKKLVLEATLKPKAGSELATKVAAMKSNTSEFAGALESDAAVSAIKRFTLSDAAAKKIDASMDEAKAVLLKDIKAAGLGAELEPAITDLANALIESGKKTVVGKEIDGGAALQLEPEKSCLVVGSKIADGAKLEAAVKKALEASKKELGEAVSDLKFDAETYKGVRFHTAIVAIPDSEEAAKAVGEKPEVVIAFSDTKVYAAFGAKATEALKAFIDGSEKSTSKSVPPFQLTVSATPILAFLEKMDDNPQMSGTASALLKMLGEDKGKDRLIVSVEPKGEEVVARVEIEEGIIKTAGVIAMAANGVVGGGETPAETAPMQLAPKADPAKGK